MKAAGGPRLDAPSPFRTQRTAQSERELDIGAALRPAPLTMHFHSGPAADAQSKLPPLRLSPPAPGSFVAFDALGPQVQAIIAGYLDREEIVLFASGDLGFAVGSDDAIKRFVAAVASHDLQQAAHAPWLSASEQLAALQAVTPLAQREQAKKCLRYLCSVALLAGGTTTMAIGIKSSSTETTVAGAGLAAASLLPAISNLLAATQACLSIRILRARRAEEAAKQADDPMAQLEESAAHVDDMEREVRAIGNEGLLPHFHLKDPEEAHD